MARLLRSTLPWAALATLLLLGVPENGVFNAVGSVDAGKRTKADLAVEELRLRIDQVEAENRALRASLERLGGVEKEIAELREQAAAREEDPVAPALHAFPVPEAVRFCDESLPLDDPDAHRRFEEEWHRFLVNRHWLITWMRRSRETFPPVEAKLAAAGLPDDLKYVMLIESAASPRATSSAGAAGYWQFIRSTGKRYGLARNSTVDERRSLDLSTDAAIAYLSDLHAEFESWPLVLSAYNAGEKRVRSEIEEQGTDDFYGLVLPRETEAYWFKAAATKVLFENRARYGFVLPDDGWVAVDCDTLLIDVRTNQLPFRDIAATTGLTYREIKQLNPHYRASSLPRGQHRLVLPRSLAASLEGGLAKVQVVARSSAKGAPPTAQPSAPGP